MAIYNFILVETCENMQSYRKIHKMAPGAIVRELGWLEDCWYEAVVFFLNKGGWGWGSSEHSKHQISWIQGLLECGISDIPD